MTAKILKTMGLAIAGLSVFVVAMYLVVGIYLWLVRYD
jgi:hypothetical protein